MNKPRKRLLDLKEIVHWCEVHHQATGRWPIRDSGPVLCAKNETWAAVDAALRGGHRGLPGGQSLAQFLASVKGKRNIHGLAPLTEEQIAAWAAHYRQMHGVWPKAKAGVIPESGGETWAGVDMMLRQGGRGVPGGSSLSQWLAERFGHRNRKRLPPYDETKLVAWAHAHHDRTGQWPHGKSGPIVDAPGETWQAVNMALAHGQRGLAGGSSLAFFLAERCGAIRKGYQPNLTLDQVLGWADAWRARTGRWPAIESGPIPESPGDSWTSVNNALRRGKRGLPRGLSLAIVLATERGVRKPIALMRFTRRQIVAWARAHHARTGQWPNRDSGPVAEAPAETWKNVDNALRTGGRGLKGSSSLAKLLARRCGCRNQLDLPPLSGRRILAWADAHHQRTGRWPNVNSGAVIGAQGESWRAIDAALRQGHRGLPGGSSLFQLLVKKRGRTDSLRPA